MLKGLIELGINGVKTLFTNARVGKQVLASGATVTTQHTGSGSNTQVGSAGSIGVPVWVMPLALGIGALLALVLIVKLIFKK